MVHSTQSISYLLMKERKYELKIKKSKSIHYSQKIDDVYENLEDYNPTKKRRLLIVKADMESNKN